MAKFDLTNDEIRAILWLIEDRTETLKEDILFYIEDYGFGSEEAEECSKECHTLMNIAIKLEEAKNDSKN